MITLLCGPFPLGAGEPEEPEVTVAESDLRVQAGEVDQWMRGVNLLVRDTALDAYLVYVLQNIRPSDFGAYSVHAICSARRNAFSMINGSIYICNGLLASMDNEAQLALLLTHEVAHVAQKHTRREINEQIQRSSSATVRQMVGSFFLGGIAIALSQDNLRKAMSGYSRDMEREADSIALRDAAGAGYRLAEAVRMLDKLEDPDDPDAGTNNPGSEYATHPAPQERARTGREQMRRLTGDTLVGKVGSEVFLIARAPALRWTVEALRAVGRHRRALELADVYRRTASDSARAIEWRGRIKLERWEGTDTAEAVTDLRTAIDRDSTDGSLWRDLGYAYVKQDRPDSARTCFEKYRLRMPAAGDTSYQQLYLRNNNAVAK